MTHNESNSSPEHINTQDQEIYGNSSHPIRFRIGNGGAGYTGILRLLSETFIADNGGNFRIGWVTNHSRHSQIALLADIVQIALTYEPENERISIEEGWAERVGLIFHDHFIIVGPDQLQAKYCSTRKDATGFLEEFADTNAARETENSLIFHTRGDGSATFTKERLLWKAAGVDITGVKWLTTYPLSPYEALKKAQEESAFLLTDRATCLTAKRDGIIPSLQAHVEGGEELLNHCSALVKNISVLDGEDDESVERTRAARRFAEWLMGSKVQKLIHEYGRNWKLGKPLFTVAERSEFDEEDRLND